MTSFHWTIINHNPRRIWIVRFFIGLLWLVTLVLVWSYATHHAVPLYEETRQKLFDSQSKALVLQQKLQKEQQQNTILRRSEQMANTANQELQQTLQQLEEALSAAQTDLSFYQRLSGGNSAKQGLTAHDFHLEPIGDSNGYAYTLTVLQNLKKTSISKGTIDITVSGVLNGQLKELSWGELQQKKYASMPDFEFKYFQRLEGTLLIPSGFIPNRVHIRLLSKAGEKAQTSFEWSEAIKDTVVPEEP